MDAHQHAPTAATAASPERNDTRAFAETDADADDSAAMLVELIELRQTLANEHAMRKLAVASADAAHAAAAMHARLFRAMVNAAWTKCQLVAAPQVGYQSRFAKGD